MRRSLAAGVGPAVPDEPDHAVVVGAPRRRRPVGVGQRRARGDRRDLGVGGRAGRLAHHHVAVGSRRPRPGDPHAGRRERRGGQPRGGGELGGGQARPADRERVVPRMGVGWPGEARVVGTRAQADALADIASTRYVVVVVDPVEDRVPIAVVDI